MLGELERLAGQRRDTVVARLIGPEQLPRLCQLAGQHRISAVLVRELAELGASPSTMWANLVHLIRYGCEPVPLYGPGLQAIPAAIRLAVLEAVAAAHDRARAVRAERAEAQGVVFGPAPLAVSDLARIGRGKGEEIAARLREPERMPVRYIADVVGVAPGTVMKVKRMLNL